MNKPVIQCPRCHTEIKEDQLRSWVGKLNRSKSSISPEAARARALKAAKTRRRNNKLKK